MRQLQIFQKVEYGGGPSVKKGVLKETILVHPTMPQIFAGKPYSTFYNIRDLLICIYVYIMYTLAVFIVQAISVHRLVLLFLAPQVL